MFTGRIVNPHKMSQVIKRIMGVMEEEGLNIAESERVPELLAEALKENSEWNEKRKPFAVYKDEYNKLIEKR